MNPRAWLASALGAFAAMEPVTAATHRWVMHGPGMRLHRSHHETRSPVSRSSKARSSMTRSSWEANDAFPVFFAAIVCTGLWIGFNRPGRSALVPVGVGVTLYGAAYALVHDLHIHRRPPTFRRRPPARSRLAEAHRIHHELGGAPYGMLLPVVPRRHRRERVAAVPRA